MRSAGEFQPRSDAPLLKARSLVHLRHRRRALAEAQRFYTDFGLELAERRGCALYLCTRGCGPVRLILEPGPHDAFLGLAVEAKSESALWRLAAIAGARVEDRDEPGGGQVPRLRDPADLEVEVVHGLAPAPLREPPAPTPMNHFARPLRVNAPRPRTLAPPWLSRLGHVVLGRHEFARNARWYIDVLGMIASDVEVISELGEPIVAFLRFDRGETPADHHSIVVAAAPEDGHLHAAFEATDVDALGAGAEWLQHRGWVKSGGVGRHVLGSQLFCYHIDPHGFEVEHYADGDLFDASHPTEYHEAGLPGLYLWGPDMPPHYPTTAALIAHGEGAWRDAAARPAALDITAVTLLSPVTAPARVICQGANYRQHVIESGLDPDAKRFNLFFEKSDASISAPAGSIFRPAHVRLLDYEVELALVFRQAITGPVTVTRESLHQVDFGLTISNDVSARDVRLPQSQFFKGKSYRSFCPLGPYLAVLDPDELRYLDQLTLTLSLMQLLMPEPRLWDLFTRGQAKRAQYLRPGDAVTATITSPDRVIDLGEPRHIVEGAMT